MVTAPSPTRPLPLLPLGLSVFAAMWIVLFLYILFMGHHRGPHYDDWDLLYFVRAMDQHTATASLLVEQFSGIHRIVIGRILFCIEYFVFSGTGYFPNSVFLLALTLSFVIFLNNIRALRLTPSPCLSESQAYLLYLTGVLAIFSCTQLFSFNYATTCFMHPGSIFLAILCFHLINRDALSGEVIGSRHAFTYLLLLCLSCLFSAAGIFAVIAAIAGLLIAKTPAKPFWIVAGGACVLAILHIPGAVIFRVDDTHYIGSVSDLIDRLHLEKTGVLSNITRYVLLYFGAPVSSVWQPGGIGFGLCILLLSTILALRYVLIWKPRFLFFQMMLYMLLAFGLATALGRYQLPENAMNGRWYPAVSWAIWTVCFFIVVDGPRLIRWSIVPVYLVFTCIGSYQAAGLELEKTRNSDIADINILNRSYIHMTYNITSFQHKILEFNPPAYFDSYLRSKKWGIYSNHIDDVKALQRNNDTCEAKPIGRWLVSEKQFFEYRLDGWNTTRDQFLQSVYALDADGKIVAYGETITREPEWLPTRWLPREKVQIYMVIPTNHDLAQLTLLGGEDGSFCTIRYQ